MPRKIPLAWTRRPFTGCRKLRSLPFHAQPTRCEQEVPTKAGNLWFLHTRSSCPRTHRPVIFQPTHRLGPDHMTENIFRGALMKFLIGSYWQMCERLVRYCRCVKAYSTAIRTQERSQNGYMADAFLCAFLNSDTLCQGRLKPLEGFWLGLQRCAINARPLIVRPTTWTN